MFIASSAFALYEAPMNWGLYYYFRDKSGVEARV